MTADRELSTLKSERLHPIGAFEQIGELHILDRRLFLRRLFSTFARGWPGAGLLLMRLVSGIALLDQAVMLLPTGHSVQSVIFAVSAIAVGVLLLLGLWTPIAGILTALFELRDLISHCD